MLQWSLSNGRLLSSDHTLAILSCLSSVLCNSQLVTMLSERESASLVCSATAAVHALVCSRECHRHRYVITDCCENLHFLYPSWSILLLHVSRGELHHARCCLFVGLLHAGIVLKQLTWLSFRQCRMVAYGLLFSLAKYPSDIPMG